MDFPVDEGPLLLAQSGLYDGQRWIVSEKILIGRDDDCDIVISNRQVSRHHAQIYKNSEGVWLEDLGSRNGTHCNGDKIQGPVLLHDGDLIHIAYAQQFIFLSSDATMPLDGKFDMSQVAGTAPTNTLLMLEQRSRRVWVKGLEIIPPLSLAQYKLLEILQQHIGQVVPRPTIIELVWGEENAIAVSDQALDALVRRLRDRLAEFDPSHQYVVTVRGHGLRLDNPTIN